MIKSRLKNTLASAIWCFLFVTLAHFNTAASPPSTNCNCVLAIASSSSCSGSNSGSATATASNGSSPYTYKWSNNATGATASGLASGTYTVTATDKNGCTVSQSVAISSVSFTVNAGADKTICKGASTQLSASGADLYSWTPTTGLSDASIANPVASPTVTTTYTVTGAVSSGELVTNGNFSSGNTGFTSQYGYNSDLRPEGLYFVGSDANATHSNFFGTGHGGSGKFMIINGATVAGVDVWKQTVTVNPNTTYYFSTWITALNNLVSANLAFKINGTLLGPVISSPSSPNSWVQFYAVWNSGSATSATISIVNQNTIASGNDFGLDDISFTTVCEKTDQVVVTVKSVTPNAGSDVVSCPGKNVTLTATGGGTYAWSTGATTASINVNPTSTTTYTVTVTNNGCSQSDDVEVAMSQSCPDWEFACTNRKVEIVGKGAAGNSSTTLTFTDVSTIDSIVVEAVCKNTTLPTSATFTSSSQTVTSTNRIGVINGTSSNHGIFRVKMNPTSSISISTNQPNQTYSVIAYVYRSGVSTNTGGAGIYTNAYIYKNSITYTLNIPATAGTKNLTVQIPITEMNNDSRVANISATAGSVTNSTSVSTYTAGQSFTLVSLPVNNVPGNVTSINITVESPNSNGDSFMPGVSVSTESCCTPMTASIAKVDAGCKKDSITTCVLTLATSQHGLWMNSIPNAPSKYHKIVGGSMTATKYSDGRLHITGTFENVSDANRKWTADVMYTNKMNWADWSAGGGTWKGQAGNVGNNYQNWDYYIMDVSYANKLTGSGTYAGKTLNLTHMPSNYLYGFQVGQGANDQTADWGMSGWFDHTGSYTGNGDFNFDAVCDSTEIILTSTCNGTADLSVSGGASPYTYSWSNGRSTQDLSGLCAGTYTVTITDGNSCTTTKTVTIGTTSALAVVCNSTDVTTQNGSNGTASVNVSGGVTPYTYLWNTGHTTQSVTNRPAGVYSVTVTDKNGCFVEYECCIKQPSVCDGFRTQTQGGWGASPNGGNPGVYLHANFATAFPSGITVGCATGFTLKLTSAQAVTDFLPSGSTPRSLTANLTNPAGTYKNVLAGQVVALTISVGMDNAIASFGPSSTLLQNLVVNTGTFANWTVAQLLAEANKKLGGCTSSYSHSQLNDAISAINESFVDGSNTGNYLKCGLDLTSVKVDVKCYGQSTGSIDLSVSGGMTPYTYRWSNNATTQDLTNVAAGTYTVTVTDAYGLTATTSVTLAQPTQLSLTTTKTDLNCYGVCAGTANVTATGGTSPYTYKWNTNATTASISNLCAGTYTVTVTDANNCTASKTATLTQPADLVSSIAKTNVSCGSGNIPCQVFHYASGSHAVYLPTLGLSTNNWLFGANGGTIETFANGTARIYGNIYLQGDTTKSFFLNFNFSNKSTWAQWSALGRTWKGDANVVGTNYQNWDYYTFSTTTASTLTGRNSYTGNNMTAVHYPANLSMGLQIGLAANDKNSGYGLSTWFSYSGWKSGQGDINALLQCASGQCDGTTTVTVSGGTTPYTYSWNTGASSQNLTGLCPGTYTVTITDGKGCKDTLTTTLTGGSELVLNATGTNIACAGVCNGTTTVSASGGQAPYTYLWSNGATSQSLSSLCAGTYIVTVTDNKGCFGKDTVVITANPKPSIAATAVPVACYGASTGSVTTTVSGGTTPYNYTWTPGGATSANLTNKAAGTYTVIVSDLNGCKDTASATIIQPNSAIDATISSTPVSCIGGNDGTATVVASGGTAPYTYSWSTTPARITAGITGLSVGSYSVTVTDANGCTVSKTVSVTGVPALTLGSVPTPVLCYGGNTGSINLTVNGGSSPYTFNWSNGRNTEDISGLTAGNYNVTVTDAKGCVATAGVSVGQPSGVLNASLVKTDVGCYGASTGTATLTVTGGTSPYTYNWGGGVTTQNRTGLAAGTYNVTVTDANACTATASVTIGQPTLLSASLVKTDVTCKGLANGTATLTVSGGTTAYTYNWGGGITTQNRTGLAPGTYTVTVTDSKACTATASVTITEPSAVVSATIVSTPVGCIGGADGTATVTPAGGTAPYTYSWSTTPARTTAAITGLSAGSYTVTVTDAKGCTATKSVTITQPDSISTSITKTDVSCGGGNIPCQVFAYASGSHAVHLPSLGLASANFVFGAQGGTIETFANGTARIYGNIYMQGDTNKSFYLDFNFSNKMTWAQWSALGRSWKGSAGTVGNNYTNWSYYIFSTTTPSTLTGRNALAGSNLTATHNPTNYQYGLQIGLAANDKNGSYGLSTWFNHTGYKSGSGDINANLNCVQGQCDGTADLTVSGGTAPYTYTWNNGVATQDLTGLCPGMYTVTITDKNGCEKTTTVTIGTGSELNVEATGTNIACAGVCNGTANVTATGGTAPFTYLWSNGATTKTLSNICAGTYMVTVTDSKGCFGKDTLVISANPKPEITATASPVNCFGASTGSVTTVATGGTTPYSYAWTPSGATTANLTNKPAGTYTVILTDLNGCKDTASATITQPADSLNGITSSTPVSCIGGTDGTASVIASGGTAPYTYVWSTTPARTTATITGLRVGNYTVTITDSKGCNIVRTVTVTGVPPLTLGSVPSPVLCNGGNTGSINLTVSGGTPGYTFQWSNGATTEDITGLIAGTYNVTVTDHNGCVATAGVSVTQPQPLVATATPVNIACNGAATGGVNLSVVGGTSPFTYSWSNGATTRDIASLTAGTYSVTVTDKNNCTATASATVTQQAALSVTATPTHVTCFGLNNGSIATSVNGGVAPYTYTWGAGQPTTANRSNLAPGTYNVTVTDANGCTGTATASITQPADSLNGVTSSTPVSCVLGTDGTASVVASGGTAPYTYAWSTTPARTTATITGLRVGSYTVTITDSKGCTVVRTVTVTGVPPLTLGSVPSPVLCNGGNTGSINLTVSGGTPGYTFQWSNGATTEDITGLIAGTYNVTVTDANGCVATAGVSVTQPQPLVATATPVNIACNGAATGGVNLSVVGGTSPFTYNWSNGATTRDIASLTAGTYSVTVTDKNNCTATASATVTQQAALSVTATPTHVTCFGLNNGSIATSVNGGVAPYTYTWGAGQPATANRSNLAPGTYNVTVTDANNCTGTATATITQPTDSLNGTTSSTPVSCIGGTDGTASVVASGGTAPYTYVWSTTPARTTSTITGLRVGSYTVTITDSKGCNIVRTVTVTGVPPLTLGSVPSPVLCNGGNTGSINLTVSGGTPGYTFQWSNGATTEDITGLIAGTYNVTVTDHNGCVATAGVSVTQPQPLVATATPVNIACNGAATGGVNLSVVGGTSPFTYLWSNGATTRDITGLTAGTYSVTVTDKNNCTATASATVTQQPSLVVNVVGTNLTCHNNNSGTATANVSGGVSPYTYVWSTIPARATATINGLSIGSYSVTVTDANGCTGTGSVVLTQPDTLEAVISCGPVACFGDTTANLTLLTVGGTAPYTYLWSTGATTRNLMNRGAGTYTVTVTDAKGCTITAFTEVTEPAKLVATATPLHIACNGAATGGVNLSVIGGTTPYTYLWSNGATTQNLTGLAAGTYSVTVTDKNGCTATATSTVNQQSALQVTATPTHIPCFGQNNGSIATSVNGGVGPYTYNWGGGVSTANRTNLAPGTYTVTVSDANSCTGTATAIITQPADSLNGTTSSTPVSCVLGTDGTASVVASGGTAPYTYAWSTTPTRTTSTITGLRVGSYTVTITDSKGCNIVRTVTVTGVPPLTLGSVPTPVLCNGGNTGSINLTVSGGTPGYTFQWSNGATTEDITGIIAGTYNVTVTDHNGCVATAGVSVTQPQPLVATATPVNIACFGANNGGVNISVVGGTSPFTYLWSNGAITRDITGVAAATYSVTITDKNNCTATASATVTQQAALSVTATPTHVTCFGLNNGSIVTSVNGGVAPYTYTWGAGQPTTANRSNLAPGTYNVTVSDANGCTGTATATITQPSAPLAASATKTDVNCYGQLTGAADLTVTGGTAPYTYVWSNAATTEDLSGLAAGTYTVTVTDAKACTTTATVTITQPNAALSASATKTDVNCYGDLTGTATLTVTGGTVAYTYAWSNGATTKDLSGLAAGTYTVTVTDAKACTATATVTITQPNAALSASATKTDVNCFGGNNGTVTLTVSGGTTAYTYLWSNGATTQNLTTLVAGTYTVTVTDAKACTATATATVTQPADSLNGITSSTPVSCVLGTDGTASVVATGGTAPYTYVWSTTPARVTSTITGLKVGTYTVTITDSKACNIVRTVTVTGVPPLTLGSVPSPVLCNGGSTGSINLTVSGGTPGYTFQWSNGATTEDITGLIAGTYNVTVTDRNGCVATAGVTVQQPQPLMPTATPVNIACFGANNGGVNLSVTGGTTPFTYSWSNGATTRDITGVAAGTYSVTITDKNNCTATASASVTQQSALSVTVTGTNLTCFGNGTGAVTTTVGGGVGPYTYTWGAGQPTTANRTGLSIGTYSVTVTDANGCTGTGSATLTQPATLTASATGSAVSCFGDDTGTVTLTVAGGTAPFTYNWSNQATSQNLSGLAAGRYNVTITDANGCTATASADVTQPTLLVATAGGSAVSCFGDITGTITLNVTGGRTGYTYLWSTGATTKELNGVGVGTYTVTVTDANGCTATSSATITEPALLVASGTNTNVLCNSASTATVTLTVTGGTAPYTYSWSNQATTQNLNGLVEGTYTVTVTDANSCTATKSFTITQPTALSATATPQDVRCFLGSDGAVSLTVSGGVGPYTYRWSNNATTQNLTALRVGTFTVTATDANGCTITASATVAQPGPLTLGGVPSPVKCFGGNTGSINLTATGGVAPYTFIWSTGATTEDISNLTAGMYNVTVTDAHNCVATVGVNVQQPAVITLNFVGVNVTTNGGTNGSIDLSVVGGTSPFTYVWSNGATTQDLNSITAGNYCVTVTDVNGCTATGCKAITEPACSGFSATAASTNVNCNGGSNGTATLTITGGTAPFTYTWSNGATTKNLTGLVAGTYTVTIKDAVNCMATANVTITEPATLTAVALGTNPSCNGQLNGSINLTVTGGTAPYTYSWNSGATSQNLTGLDGNTFNVTVTDAKGCTATASATLVTPGALDVANVVTQVRCFLGNDGAITTTVSGGTAPYTYRWSNGATTKNLTALRAGTYGLTVTDANGCTAVKSILVTQPGPLTLGGAPTPVSCFQGNNGSINLTATGGTAPYVFNWSNGATTEDISGLVAGNYNVTVTDARSCVATVSVTVQQPAAIVLSANVTDACAGGNSGAIQLNVVGGTSPFTYAWNNGASTKNIGSLAPGTYTATVTDSKGCTSTNSFNVGSNVNCRTMEFTINMFLEGPFEQSNMMMQNKLRTQCNTVPLYQPYNSPTMGYNGTESVGSLGNNVVDWVLVSFRSNTDRNTEIYKVAGLLSRDGKVRTVSGDTIFQLNSSPTDSLFVVVEHRNHMGAMTPVKMCANHASGNSVICVDFTRMQSFVSGTPATAGQKLLGTDSRGAIYGLHSGDGDCNFDINSSDFVPFGTDFNKFDIYSPGDFNMDCDCNSNDLPKWLGNFNQFSGVR